MKVAFPVCTDLVWNWCKWLCDCVLFTVCTVLVWNLGKYVKVYVSLRAVLGCSFVCEGACSHYCSSRVQLCVWGCMFLLLQFWYKMTVVCACLCSPRKKLCPRRCTVWSWSNICIKILYLCHCCTASVRRPPSPIASDFIFFMLSVQLRMSLFLLPLLLCDLL